MTNKQLKNEFKQQAYAAVPDKCEELLKTVAAQSDRAASLSDDGDEPHLVPVVPATSQKTAERWLALAACFVVVLVAVIIATNRDDTQLTKRGVAGGDVTTTTTAFGTVPSASGSGETGGSVSGATGSNGSQSGGTATLSAASGTQTTNVSGTQTTNVSGLPFQTGGSRISGTISGGTKQKGATTVTTRSTSKWWIDFGIDTTKGGNTTKFVPGDATTQKTIAPSAKPTTKRTTAPTTKPTTAPTTRPTEPTCNHMIEYRVPVSWDGQPVPAADTCVNQVTPTEPSAAPTEPSAAPTQRPPVVKDGFTYTVTYSVPAAQTYGVSYRIYTEVVFNDGWKTQYWSECDGTTVLYTNVKTTTKSGVCTYEQTYDPKAKLLTVIRRNQDGAVTYQNTLSVPLGDSRFLVID